MAGTAGRTKSPASFTSANGLVFTSANGLVKAQFKDTDYNLTITIGDGD